VRSAGDNRSEESILHHRFDLGGAVERTENQSGSGVQCP
jgi:hypothetical protein